MPAIALTGAQCNIRTDGSFNRARIQSIDTARIEEELAKGKVVIVAGFQGVTENDEVTTLGRGGGDITGAAVAAALNASVCEICTDVDGVLSADPNVVPDARFWPELSYEAAIEMASSGAKVLHPRAAEICMSYNIPIHIRSSFHLKEGTWIREGANSMEEAEIVGVTSDKKIAKVTLLNVPDQPGIAAQIFKDVADKDINIRLIIQSAAADHRAGITFIIEDEFADGTASLSTSGRRKGSPRKDGREGIRDHRHYRLAPGRHARACRAGCSRRSHREKINVDCISSSEMTMSCVIALDQIDRGVKAVHDEFFANAPARSDSAAVQSAAQAVCRRVHDSPGCADARRLSLLGARSDARCGGRAHAGAVHEGSGEQLQVGARYCRPHLWRGMELVPAMGRHFTVRVSGGGSVPRRGDASDRLESTGTEGPPARRFPCVARTSWIASSNTGCSTARKWSRSFSHMLQHVVNHATFHRGQVTTMLSQLGVPAPKPQDLIRFFRERATRVH